MITHYIIMSSSYSRGKRIALNYIVDDGEYSELKEIISSITEQCGKDVSVSTHFIQTDSKSWDSVIKKDHFFKNVEVIDNIDNFINLIKEDRKLNGLDVAKYILSKVKCTHLKLEKLVYLSFAEYLCKYDRELYEDQIFAYKYGPVVKSVYDRYKRYGYEEIENDNIDATDVFEMPSRSRILFAEDGVQKLSSIDGTINRYGNLTAGELVDITHRKNTPWYLSGRGKLNDEIIKNDIIKKYHCNELV